MYKLVSTNGKHTFKNKGELTTFLKHQNPYFMGIYKTQLTAQSLTWNGDFGAKLKIEESKTAGEEGKRLEITI